MAHPVVHHWKQVTLAGRGLDPLPCQLMHLSFGTPTCGNKLDETSDSDRAYDTAIELIKHVQLSMCVSPHWHTMNNSNNNLHVHES